MKKNLILSFLLIAFISLIAFTYKDQQPPKYKNLQVLPKDISKVELDSIMDVFKTSLGVKCSFCHARWEDSTKKGLDFASDAKPQKETTRSMMRMTVKINEMFFNSDNSTRPDTIHTVICYTCHRDFPTPDSKKLMEELEQMQMQMPGK